MFFFNTHTVYLYKLKNIKDDISTSREGKKSSSYPEEWCGFQCSELSGGSQAPLSAGGTAATALQTALPDSGNN